MNQLEMTIDQVLLECKIPHGYLGRAYLEQALKILYETDKPHITATALYSEVAKEFKVDIDSVERNIRGLFSKIDYSAELSKMLFIQSEKTGRVKNKQALYSLLTEIKRRLNNID